MHNKDSLANTLIVALSVCIVCSLLVSAAAVGLRDKQKKNVEEDRKSNILRVAGFDAEAVKQGGGIEKLFSAKVKPDIINLETGRSDVAGLMNAMDGKYKTEDELFAEYDGMKVAKENQKFPKASEKLNVSSDIAGLGGSRENYAFVYRIVGDNQGVEKYVFPIRGRGLWSTLKGFIALRNDLKTVAGITYYEHGETPGLGGEVDNAGWKAKWDGKKVYDTTGDVKLTVVKGSASNEYQIDGLSGATITSKGVTSMIDFWLGPNGFKPFIENELGAPQKVVASSDLGRRKE